MLTSFNVFIFRAAVDLHKSLNSSSGQTMLSIVFFFDENNLCEKYKNLMKRSHMNIVFCLFRVLVRKNEKYYTKKKVYVKSNCSAMNSVTAFDKPNAASVLNGIFSSGWIRLFIE